VLQLRSTGGHGVISTYRQVGFGQPAVRREASAFIWVKSPGWRNSQRGSFIRQAQSNISNNQSKSCFGAVIFRSGPAVAGWGYRGSVGRLERARCGAARASSAGVGLTLAATRHVPKHTHFQAASLSASKKFILQGLFPSAERKHVI